MNSVSIPTWRHVRLYNVALAICWLIYAAVTLANPTQRNPYHLTELQTILLNLTIIIPLGVIWYIALRGATAFKNYATMVHDAKEAPGLNAIANGLLMAVAYLVVIALAGAAVQVFTGSRFANAVILLRDHLPALIGLVSFVYLYIGGQQLAGIAGFDTWDRRTLLIISGYMLFAILFVLAFTHAEVPPPSSTRSSLAIVPHSVLLFTLILPYLTSWFLGILASVNIARYASRVKGLLYRQALVNLVRGIISVISFGILLQLLGFSTRYLTGLSLGKIILILYAIIILYGLGFIFIRSGAKMLSRIEVVQ